MNFLHDSNSVYLSNVEGKSIAYVTFADKGNGVVEIDHTYVNDSLRGQGVAGKLMTELAQRLRKEGLKAFPSCTYAVSWFDKNPEYKDILFK